MIEDKPDQKEAGRSTARRRITRPMTRDLVEQIVILYENTRMTQREIAYYLRVNQGRVSELIARGNWLRRHPDAPSPADESPLSLGFDEGDEDDDESDEREDAALSHFGDLCATLKATAELLQREVADDLHERLATLVQMSETEDIIQKKIDKAEAWLARRAG
jgi:predicted XRE-type DNA-binding protein